MPDDFKYQISDKIQDAILVVRGDELNDVVGDFGTLKHAFQQEFSGPQPGPAQATQNVVREFGGNTQVVPTTGRPGNGEIFPGKTCPSCNSQVKVRAGISQKSGKPYYVLDCSANKEHKGTWQWEMNK